MSFEVTREMLERIARVAMGLRDCSHGHRPAVGEFFVRDDGIGGFGDCAVLVCHDEQFAFGNKSHKAACDLLMWCVRDRGWAVHDLWADTGEAACVVQSHGGRPRTPGYICSTLCEAIIRAILAVCDQVEALG